MRVKSKIVPDVFRGNKWLQRLMVDGKYTWIVSGVLWNNIKERCDPNSSTQRHIPKYIGSKNGFKDFQSFVEWNRKQIGYGLAYDVDADILKGATKVYSESTCLLIPPELNRFLQRHNPSDSNQRGVTLVKGVWLARLTMKKLDGEDTKVLSSYFKDKHLAVAAYVAARNEAIAVWRERLNRGDYLVDRAVVDYMNNLVYKEGDL